MGLPVLSGVWFWLLEASGMRNHLRSLLPTFMQNSALLVIILPMVCCHMWTHDGLVVTTLDF